MFRAADRVLLSVVRCALIVVRWSLSVVCNCNCVMCAVLLLFVVRCWCGVAVDRCWSCVVVVVVCFLVLSRLLLVVGARVCCWFVV